jgi:hypothetical protein
VGCLSLQNRRIEKDLKSLEGKSNSIKEYIKKASMSVVM